MVGITRGTEEGPCTLGRALMRAPNSRLWNGLQLPNHPAISPGRHQYDVVHHDMFVVNIFSPVRDAQFVLRSIVQLHDVALGGIKYRFQVMRLIRVLAGQTGALLAGPPIAQPSFWLAGQMALAG